jgi:hypothetical protein
MWTRAIPSVYALPPDTETSTYSKTRTIIMVKFEEGLPQIIMPDV